MTTTSQPQPAGSQDLAACRRPGCGQPLPPPGRGRTRQFCSDDCARRYHNDARIPATASTAIAADVATHVEVVEQHELAGKLMMIRADVFFEEA